VVLEVDTNVSEKHAVSIVRAEDGDSLFLRNDGINLQNHTAPKPNTTSAL
jgi:hypothetical protein